MNPVEIGDAITDLAQQPFDAAEFPFQFLEAFGNKKTAIDRLRKGNTNQSDIPGAVLQRSHIHIATCQPGTVGDTLTALRSSPKTTSQKARFILATDGDRFEAEDVTTGETVVCDYPDFANHFGFFLPLAGITTVAQIRESSFDIRATGRLNKLYVTLLQDNPEWAAADRRSDMNHFMARLIFCFFAEDTDIFHSGYKFTETVTRMTSGGADNTHEVIQELFRAMNTPLADRTAAGIKTWANGFPYVNGQLFSGNIDVPRFSRTARGYLIHIGNLDWTKINPDIFGSMIQAVADDEERGALGMHYTSVPNILKVLNPLFLDDLRAKLEEAGDNARKLLNLRNRMAKIRVFDPACGSGNFLVIAYKEMRAIEAEINKRRGEPDRRSEIPLTNFRGIELRDFPAEIARLALIIAEYQCDVLYRGQKEALAEFLPLDSQNWITCGNALRLDWLSICPPTGTGVKVRGDDLFQTPLDQSEIDFENAGGETYICGNPPYIGYNKQSAHQKSDLENVFSKHLKRWGNLDYVAAWIFKAALFMQQTESSCAFVTTNTICQGGQVPILWPEIFARGARINFAHTSFKWANLASRNAGITVIIVGLSKGAPGGGARLYSIDADGLTNVAVVENLNGYLVPAANVFVRAEQTPVSGLSKMNFGNHPYYGGPLIFDKETARQLIEREPILGEFLRPIYGSTEVISGLPRVCIWATDDQAATILSVESIADRLNAVRNMRAEKLQDGTAQQLADKPYRFRDQNSAGRWFIAVPQTTSENREYLPCDLLTERAVVTFKCFALNDAPLWNMALIASRLHWVWIGTVCARMRTDFSYSNTLGWNTFPLPKLTEQNKADLTVCAENILLAREAHFPATIADLYDPEAMPENLRRAHEENDETLERIYIGRRFKNDTERLEKLFELYTKMTGKGKAA
ncbi:class I SAM-dependent DNA methyltransferase [Erythrobacter sp. BLCC-B19]|uniref:class I SAM-dependent DNA methyltransferase n=1 Tax=Erythrobacter sp. BLCC-B19 TaxID=3025315 RepID=UPI002361DB5A|nr:DNA methyltransferase [Erythrobacter sp. BLCC-B19]WDA41726.1 lactate dehydrogenase [Erythrobacter sp. BLCC-B19]